MNWIQDTNGKWWWQGQGYTEGPYEDPNFDRPLPSIGHWSQNSDGSWWSTERPGEHYASPGGARHVPAPSLPPAQQVPSGTAPATDPAKSGKALFQSQLDQYGLSALGDWAWERFLVVGDWNQVMLELRQRPEYEARFPAMNELAAKGRAISEGEYVNYEKRAAQIFSFAGLNHFVTPQYLESLIAGEVSLDELSWRIGTEGYGAVTQAPPEVRQMFAEWFGPAGDAALAAWFLDADNTQPLIEDAIGTAQAGGYAKFFGFEMTKEGAKLIGDIAPSPQALVAGFQEAIRFKPLTYETISETTDLTVDETVQAAFGTGGSALEEFRQRIESRAAMSRGGGGALLTEKGVVGAGSAGQ